MKYIRTKDGILPVKNIKVENGITYATSVWSGIEYSSEETSGNDIADTIEDLCDCFVEVGLGNPMIVTWEYVLNDEDRRNFDVYGAISTAKGIIYVAKLNEKGELELL